MKNIILTILSLLVVISVSAQITTNTNFKPNISQPLDLRKKPIVNLADTSTITFPYEDLKVWVSDLEVIYRYNGSQWSEFVSGIKAGETIFYIEEPDTTYTINVLDTVAFDFSGAIGPTDTLFTFNSTPITQGDSITVIYDSTRLRSEGDSVLYYYQNGVVIDSNIIGTDGVITNAVFNGATDNIDVTVAAPGSSFSFDATPLLDNTDTQDLSFLGTTLTLTDGGSVDLSSLQDGTGTDDQTIDVLSLIGNTLNISLEGDGEATQTLDLSPIQDGTGTDDQAATEVGVTPSGNLGSTNVQAALEEHQSDIDALSSGGSDGVITNAVFNVATDSIDVSVASPGTNFSFDVSALLDNTDSQDLSLTGNTLSLTGDATTVDLSSYLDNTDSQAISLSGNTLSITGNASTVDLSAYLDNTDTQLTQAQVEDFAGGIFTGNTETLITATYQGSDNTLDLVVEDDLSLYDNTNSGFLTSEVDGSITNEIQTFDQTLAEGSTLTANRAVTLSGNSFQINGATSQLQMDANSGLLTSLNGSLDFGDISTTAADIVLRHRLSGDVADQDYLYLNNTGLDLAHRNAITLASDTLNWNTGIVSMGQDITVNSNNNSILYSMTGAGDFDITTNSSDVLI